MSQKHEENTVDKRLQDLLLYPREDLDKEIKGWLNLDQEDDKANLAQAIIALANYGGGYVLIGFAREGQNWIPADPRPPDSDRYTQDMINGIVEAYADPPFHCGVYLQLHPESGHRFPIIVVPGNHRVPIRTKKNGPNQRHVHKNTYPIRRPGPKSEPPMTGQEWDDLIGRCVRAARENLLDNIRDIFFGFRDLSSALTPQEEKKKRLDSWIDTSKERWKSLVEEKLGDEKPSRYSKGIWYVAYSFVDEIQPLDLADLMDAIKKVEGHESGWPPWWVPTRTGIAPYSYGGLIECFLGPKGITGDAAHSDFWLASPHGMMFLLRGYQEDSTGGFEPGTRLDLILPIWRVGECLLHAERLANAIGHPSTAIIFRVTWTGLTGRRLVDWASRGMRHLDYGPSQQESVASEIVISADRISPTLPEIVGALTKPLYEIFDFFRLPPQMIQDELARMRRP
jgi:hypothetical protein